MSQDGEIMMGVQFRPWTLLGMGCREWCGGRLQLFKKGSQSMHTQHRVKGWTE